MPYLAGHKRYAELLRKLLAASGGDVGFELDPLLHFELSASLDAPEFRFLADEKLFATFGDSPAVAGEFSYVRIANPADSGVLLIVEGVILSNPAAAAGQALLLENDGLDVPAVDAAVIANRDRRWTKTTSTTLATRVQTGSAAAAADGPAISEFILPASSSLYLPLQMVVDSGRNVEIICATANTRVLTSWWCRERTVERYEARR